jgi:hypothetical protein
MEMKNGNGQSPACGGISSRRREGEAREGVRQKLEGACHQVSLAFLDWVEWCVLCCGRWELVCRGKSDVCDAHFCLCWYYTRTS